MNVAGLFSKPWRQLFPHDMFSATCGLLGGEIWMMSMIFCQSNDHDWLNDQLRPPPRVDCTGWWTRWRNEEIQGLCRCGMGGCVKDSCCSRFRLHYIAAILIPDKSDNQFKGQKSQNPKKQSVWWVWSCTCPTHLVLKTQWHNLSCNRMSPGDANSSTKDTFIWLINLLLSDVLDLYKDMTWLSW